MAPLLVFFTSRDGFPEQHPQAGPCEALYSPIDFGALAERSLVPVGRWLEQTQKGNAGSKTPVMASFPENEQLRLQYMGKLGPNEFLLRLAKDSSANIPAQFSSELGLTTREGEVLSWLSKGKTNRDIAQILGLSPRTVDKHLEQIYAKLGVENRTAAAAVATSASRRNS